ncbi:MAG: hypothetical protein J2P21_30280, partial [Chloracidobacterium sp.]|nr:hypothetical protein [Chloracidobacterium sp.]
RNVRLDNDLCGLFACNTGFALVGRFNRKPPQPPDWRRIPGRPLLNSQDRSSSLDVRDALFQETPEEG